ncbi:GDSL esterase/lipase At1g20120-like [Salvia splendens]|uniref:GDSL esterase/lipase At1g20120-like n=1 Tax=Salvia splendens TaxID=180675 RepID=UPI001C277CB8|nr:GDSL esterase/lipase At1g20120-like [Salvia splendens]
MEKNSHLPILFLLLSISIKVIPAAAATARPSAIYAFGDALLDPGNNNNLPTVCRANHKPYGLDFPGRSPTGRFTNGKLPGDMLVSAFRIKDLLPAYADSTVDVYRLLTGVSFASACSGYHDVTAASVGVVNLDKQFKNFEKAFVKMEERFGIQLRECKAKHNKDAKEYNVKLQVRVRRMMVAMPTLKVVYMDIFNPMMEMIDKPNQFGFKSTVEGCCGSGWVELGPLCNVASVACNVHSEYVFWDSINPSEAAYKALTNK